MDLRESLLLDFDESRHWYYQTKAGHVDQLLATHQVPHARVLDVGAGSGFFARHLLAQPGTQEAVCIDTAYTTPETRIVAGKPFRRLPSLPDFSAELLLFMDVLEHVDDDVSLLKAYVESQAGGAHVLISVPAFEALWSAHDDFLGHRRRYRLQALESVARSAGLEVIRGCYGFSPLILPAWFSRRLIPRLRIGTRAPSSQLKSSGPCLNRLALAVHRLEFPFFINNRCAGLTAYCLAVKP